MNFFHPICSSFRLSPSKLFSSKDRIACKKKLKNAAKPIEEINFEIGGKFVSNYTGVQTLISNFLEGAG